MQSLEDVVEFNAVCTANFAQSVGRAASSSRIEIQFGKELKATISQ